MMLLLLLLAAGHGEHERGVRRLGFGRIVASENDK
jgi:hypothetical protein